jgi:putative aminopeptidase FrvX
VDRKGNLIVAIGEQPERLFLAHMDELGFEVTEIQSDGKLWAETRGGGSPEFFEWHPGLVHTPTKSLPALLLGGGGGLRHRVQVDFGARSAEEARAAGVRVGDTASVRKKYRRLLGTRVSSRSLDDRVGCAVLVEALRALKPEQIRRPSWFVFTVEEEVGLRGAAALAETARPREVYAIDTFVSSDSPLENPRMAAARLGGGFVIRAADSSGMTPRTAVQEVVELARRHGILVQYGVTSGANDGSQFVPGGAVNIPLGWPLRYSHSPAELIDLADVEALGKIVRALAVK